MSASCVMKMKSWWGSPENPLHLQLSRLPSLPKRRRLICFLLRGSPWLPTWWCKQTHTNVPGLFLVTGVPSRHQAGHSVTCWNPRVTPEKSLNLSDVIGKLTPSGENVGIFIYKIKFDLLKPLRMIFGPPEKVKSSSRDVYIRLLCSLMAWAILMESQNSYLFFIWAVWWPVPWWPSSGLMSAGIGSSPPWPCIRWAAINNSWMDGRRHSS